MNVCEIEDKISLPPSSLKKYGFGKRFVPRKTEFDPPPTLLHKEGIYMLRIHILIWLMYDTSDGFVSIMQKSEPAKYSPGKIGKDRPKNENEIRDIITLPKPIRTEEDMDLLLRALIVPYVHNPYPA